VVLFAWSVGQVLQSECTSVCICSATDSWMVHQTPRWHPVKPESPWYNTSTLAVLRPEDVWNSNPLHKYSTREACHWNVIPASEDPDNYPCSSFIGEHLKGPIVALNTQHSTVRRSSLCNAERVKLSTSSWAKIASPCRFVPS
jgi:hypothetical protein